MAKLSSQRKEAILEKLARHVSWHKDDSYHQARKVRNWGTASKALSYGGMGAILGSMLVPKHGGRLAAAGMGGILGSMVASDISRSKRQKLLQRYSKRRKR